MTADEASSKGLRILSELIIVSARSASGSAQVVPVGLVIAEMPLM
jgi:hypothetical protein